MKLLDAGGIAVAYTHEAFHWAAARLLGLNARIEVDPAERIAFTDVAAGPAWKHSLIALAPLAGLVVYAWLYLTSPAGPISTALLAAAALAWLLGCLHDFAFVRELLAGPKP
mgnify:CR=1 FL=1